MKNYWHILSGNISQEERKKFYKNLQESSEEEKHFLLQKNIYSLQKAEQFSTSQEHKEESFTKFWNKIEDTKSRKLFIHQFYKYAAIFLLMLLTGLSTFYFTSQNGSQVYVYESQKASTSSIKLSDGSEIWLNSNSKVEITENKKGVRATLVGEAYFDVVHNSKREFNVNLGSIIIHDLGTTFNVRAYPEDPIFTTTLMNGDLDILDQNSKYISNLDPGESAVFNRSNGTIRIDKTDTSIHAAWKDSKFVFIDKSLDQICQELEKWYGIQLIIQDTKISTENYTCIIHRSTTIKQVLDILKTVSGINYTIKLKTDGEEIIIIE